MSHLILPALTGPFTIHRQIAMGASSVVYQAVHSDRDEAVALKVFHPQFTADPDFAQRLQREAETLQSIQHPNVVRMIRAWNLDGRHFLEMEYVPGETLSQWAAHEPSDWFEPRIYLLAQIARALGAVHQGQIVHRDLKPENILITPLGHIKLTDFGLAKSQMLKRHLTQTGSIVGSLAYMAPETIGGQRATFASDIFSFGVLAFELLTGTHPFFDAQGQLQVQNILAGKAESSAALQPRVPFEVAQLLTRCLAADPRLRPTSIWSVESALLEYLQGQGLLAQAKCWVESPNLHAELLPEALEHKHAHLQGVIEQTLAEPARDMRVLVSRINEFHALFADDPAVPGFLKELSAAPAPRRLYLAWLLIFLATLPLLWMLRPAHPTVTPAVLPVKVAAPAPSVPIATPPVTAAPARGTLQIVAEPDVAAQVDGRPIARSRFANLKLAPGTHALRLEKPGYPAIVSSVKIGRGKVTRVNTIPKAAP